VLERLLGDVFSKPLVADELAGRAENGSLEPPYERVREVRLAGHQPGEQHIVGES
jgi:hypothetical protein